MIRVGIIGCGKIAQIRHIPEYRNNLNAEIAGYYDFNKERADELSKTYGGETYVTVENMLEDKTIHAVSICAANNAHAELSIKALTSGKHVLCEKPMAMTLEDCISMVKAAKENGRYLMIGQNQRLTKAHIKAKKMIEQGIIGEIITFKTTFGHGGPETWSIDPGKTSWFFDKNKASMGAMADLGVHKTDLIQYLLGENVVETTAKVVTLNKRDIEGNLIAVDDNAICIYKMKSGILGTMTASWSYYGEEDNSTILYGTKGIMKIYDNPEFAITVTTDKGEKILFDIEKIQTNDNQTKSGIIDSFIESIIENKEPNISGESVLHAMKAIFASIESSETGKTIIIEEGEK